METILFYWQHRFDGPSVWTADVSRSLSISLSFFRDQSHSLSLSLAPFDGILSLFFFSSFVRHWNCWELLNKTVSFNQAHIQKRFHSMAWILYYVNNSNEYRQCDVIKTTWSERKRAKESKKKKHTQILTFLPILLSFLIFVFHYARKLILSFEFQWFGFGLMPFVSMSVILFFLPRIFDKCVVFPSNILNILPIYLKMCTHLCCCSYLTGVKIELCDKIIRMDLVREIRRVFQCVTRDIAMNHSVVRMFVKFEWFPNFRF